MSHDAQFTHAHMVRFGRELPASPDRIRATLAETQRLPGRCGEGTSEIRAGGKVEER